MKSKLTHLGAVLFFVVVYVAAMLLVGCGEQTTRFERDGVCYEHARSWDLGFQDWSATYPVECGK